MKTNFKSILVAIAASPADQSLPERSDMAQRAESSLWHFPRLLSWKKVFQSVIFGITPHSTKETIRSFRNSSSPDVTMGSISTPMLMSRATLSTGILVAGALVLEWTS